jgi:xanthine dehydrogenase accessory factor
MNPWPEILALIERDGFAALVTVAKAEGSTPREAGARMIVRRDGTISGSIGGGPLEWNAIDLVKSLLEKGRGAEWKSVPLGPEIDQCCGGRAELLHEVFSRQDRAWIEKLAASGADELFTTATRVGEGPYIRSIVPDAPAESVLHEAGVLSEHFGDARTALLLFGAGHVGRALVKALAGLPFAVRWIDSRPDAFAGDEQGIVSALPESELRDAPENSFVLVMTHSHALDLALVTAALTAGKFPYVGLIGSATKRALFERRLAEFGVAPQKIASLVCPIGVPGISGKSPAVIAAAVAAELLQKREQLDKTTIRTEIAVG